MLLSCTVKDKNLPSKTSVQEELKTNKILRPQDSPVLDQRLLHPAINYNQSRLVLLVGGRLAGRVR